MLAVNQDFRRTNLEGWIAANPSTATVYRKGRTSDDADTTFSVPCRVSPYLVRPLSAGSLTGEVETIRYLSVMVTAWDETALKPRDLVHIVHDGEGIAIDYVALAVRRTPHKYEIILEEVQ